MKKQHSFKRMFAMGLALFALIATASADWTTYDCSVTPEAYEFSAGSSGDNFIGTADLIDDVDNAGNKLLDMRSSDANKYYWKNSFGSDLTTDSAITVVFRMKAETTDSGKVAEFQIYNGSYYDKFYFTDGKVDSNKDGESSVSLADLVITDFNIYRITLKGDAFNVWINDVLVLTGTTKGEKDDAPKFVFGDSSDSKSYAATYDWIIWDVTGAYAPGEGSDYPAGYVILPLVDDGGEVGTGNWDIYDASETPETAGFGVGNDEMAGTATIIDDADNAGNKLLDMRSSEDDKYYWKSSNLGDSYDPETGFTVVFRVKAPTPADSASVIEMEMAGAYMREKVRIYSDGTLNLEKAGVDFPLTVDVKDFNVYRVNFSIVVDGADTTGLTKVWVNDVYATEGITTSTTSSKRYQFGDSNSGKSYASIIDWIILDETGAYGPNEGSAYPSSLVIAPLTGGEVVIPDFLRFDDLEVGINSEAQTIAGLGLEANTSWTIGTTTPWITSVTPLAGDSGVATFSVTVEENTGAAPRIGTVYALIDGELVDQLTVTQEGQAVLITPLSATASSAQVKDGVTKDAPLAIDADETTAWVPSDGIVNGAYEWVKVALEPATDVVMVKITEYKNNARLTAFSVDYWNGTEYVETLPLQFSPVQAIANSEVAYSLPSVVSTDTIMFKFYGNTEDLTETDPSTASGWLTISEVSLWGEAPSTAINETNGVEFSVYPNPSAGNFTITEAAGSDIKVISLTGQVVFQKLNISANEQVSLNVQNGIYLLQVGDAVSKIAIK